MIKRKRTFLILGGKAYRNLIDFWIGFINVQRGLTSEDEIIFVGHTWDENDKNLISTVYGSKFIASDSFDYNQDVKMAMNRIKEIYNQQHDIEIPNLIYMYQSRRYALELLISNFDLYDSDRFLITRYDIGYRKVTPEVSEIVIDDAFPRDYVYLPYYHEIDEGYGDQWMVFNNQFLDFFIRLDSNILVYLSSNDYYNSFSRKWLNSYKKPNYKTKIFYFKKYFINKILPLLEKIEFQSAFFSRKRDGLLIKLRDNRDLIKGTAEIELPHGTSFSKYPIENAINSHALLKYAIYHQNIRNSVRFLDYRDFSKNGNGRLISPEPLAILIYSHSSYSDCWEMTIEQFNKYLVYSNYKIYLAAEASSSSNKALENLNTKVVPIFYDEFLSYTKRLGKVMHELVNLHEVVYFVHEDMPLYASVDSIYLNSLIKYLITSDEFYIKLIDTNYVKQKEKHKKFPDLVANSGLYSLSIQPSLIKPKDFVNLVKGLDLTIYEFEKYMFDNTDSFSAVKGSRRIGKFLYINDYFPHIATALFKGKWTTTEWGVRLTELFEVYKIDADLRGKI